MEDKRHKCVYCSYWIVSPVKKSNLSSNKMIHRKCPITNKLVNIDSECCKYFSPADIIHCDTNSQRINIVNCMVRRRNPRGFAKAYKDCKKCRQFDQELIYILEDYYIGTKEILELEVKQESRKIMRRKGHPKKKKKRTIKRRKKKATRVIKRRSALTKGLDIIKTVKPRKIKRR